MIIRGLTTNWSCINPSCWAIPIRASCANWVWINVSSFHIPFILWFPRDQGLLATSWRKMAHDWLTAAKVCSSAFWCQKSNFASFTVGAPLASCGFLFLMGSFGPRLGIPCNTTDAALDSELGELGWSLDDGFVAELWWIGLDEKLYGT